MVPLGIRGRRSETKSDNIIIEALEMDSPRADTYEEFLDNVPLADDDIYRNGTWAWYGCGSTFSMQDLSPMPTRLGCV